MSIHEKLIASMKPGLVADEVIVGAHLTAVRSGDRCGFSATLRSSRHEHTRPEVKSAGALAGRALHELSQMVFSDLPLEASIGMAAINAGLEKEGLSLSDKNGADLLHEKAAGRSVVVVGHFPFVEKLRTRAGKLAVLEQEPRSGDLPAHEAKSVMPGSDLVAITGSAFANRSVEGLLELCQGKWVMVLGPTAPLSPVLFDYGVSAIAGSLVSDLRATLGQVREGAIYRQLTGVRRVLLLS